MRISAISGWFGIKFPLYSPDDDGGISDISVMSADDDSSDDNGDDNDNPDAEDEVDNSGDDADAESDVSDDTENESPNDDEDEANEDGKEESEEQEEELEKVDESKAEEIGATWTSIKKAFPDFAKKFPDVKAALFREAKYGEMFGNPAEAETAVNQASVFNQMSRDLVDLGDPTALLNTVNKQNPESAKKIALSTLKFFQANDQDFYATQLAAIPIKQVLRAAYRDGKGKGPDGKDSDLAKAAQWIHKFFFDNTDIEKALDSEVEPKNTKTERETELERKLQEIDEREAKNFGDAVDSSYIRTMTSYVSAPLLKDSRLTDYTRDKLVNDIMIDVKRQMFSDKAFVKKMTTLQAQAKSSGYSNDSKTRIINAALVRAKSLVPDTRKRLLAKAVAKGSGKPGNKEQQKVVRVDRKANTATNRGNNQRTTNNGPKSDLDIIRGR